MMLIDDDRDVEKESLNWMMCLTCGGFEATKTAIRDGESSSSSRMRLPRGIGLSLRAMAKGDVRTFLPRWSASLLERGGKPARHVSRHPSMHSPQYQHRVVGRIRTTTRPDVRLKIVVWTCFVALIDWTRERHCFRYLLCMEFEERAVLSQWNMGTQNVNSLSSSLLSSRSESCKCQVS